MKKTPAATKVTTSAHNSADSTELVLTTSAEPRVDSRLLAKQLGGDHANVFELVTNYRTDFEQLGVVRFQTEKPLPGSKGGRPERFTLLNEDQAYLLLTYRRNTAKVRALKVKLVKSFSSARRAATVRQTEYMPAYHDLQDGIHALAAGSKNERFNHMNAAKAVNKAVGIEAGQRPGAALPTQSLLTVANMLAAGAVRSATDKRQIQERIHAALQPIKVLTARHMGISLEGR